jgi:hypothetical protein
MPNLDGTGPMGKGLMTGRGMGRCSTCGNIYNNAGRGRGLGIRRFWSSPESSLQDLKVVQEQLEQELKELKAEITSAEKPTN